MSEEKSEKYDLFPTKNTSDHIVELPQPVKMDYGGNHKVGHFIRQNIIYLYDLVEKMNAAWVHIQEKLMSEESGVVVSEEGREAFWRHKEKAKEELLLLYKISNVIGTGCKYLRLFHKENNICRAQCNLLHRSEYLLYITLSAIADLRQFSWRDFLFDETPQKVLEVPWISNPELPDQTQWYMAGCSLRTTHLYPLFCSAPFLYKTDDPTVNPRILLPRHFVNLLILNYGEGFAIQAPLVRMLLVRYALFLSTLVWRPALHADEFGREWFNIRYILDFEDELPPLSREGYLPHPRLCKFYEALEAFRDRDGLDSTEGAIANIEDKDAPGISVYDMTEEPPDTNSWLDFMYADWLEDARTNPAVLDGCFSRLLL